MLELFADVLRTLKTPPEINRGALLTIAERCAIIVVTTTSANVAHDARRASERMIR